jgi:hypothetical protein
VDRKGIVRKAAATILLVVGGLSFSTGHISILAAGFPSSPQQQTVQSKATAKAAVIQVHPAEAVQLHPGIATLACSVSGTVRDPSGAVVPGAAVRVIEAATGAVHSLASDNTGFYCALSLPAGRYSITFDKPGFRSTRLEAVTIAAGHPVRSDVVMPVTVILEESKKKESKKIDIPPPPSPTPNPIEPQKPIEPEPEKAQPVQKESGGGSGGASGDSLGEAEAKWFSQLPSGSIQYNVPPVMTIGQPSTVSVIINGYKAPPLPPQADGTAPAPLKVSEWMRVEISQPGNPDEFTITGDPNQNPQFVPIDAGATWTWTVTPNHLGKEERLQFQAFVLYRDDKSKVQRELPSAEKIVAVRTEGIKGIAHRVQDNFWFNPTNWFKYMLPGGAGFAALIALIGWLQKRRNKPERDKAQAKHAAK